MAVSSNRSPSPISTRPNPNSRTPETNTTIRRSFSGNPFTGPSIVAATPKGFNPITPANSPADYARRNSFHVLSSRDYEKENEKDQNPKPTRVRSPAVSKGTKNFMSPTISASSKIAASPRKKVLAERNEPVRTSISVSDGKGPFDSVNLSDVTEDTNSKTEMDLNQKDMEEASCDSTLADSDCKEVATGLGASSISEASKRGAVLNSQVPLKSVNVSASLSETITVESDCINPNPSSKIKSSCSLSSPILAPLDADPSLPPYDPKTNYLSPRPQFLHYRPNPRIEVYLNNESGVGLGEGKRLEDSFTSESLSDTEEAQSEDSQKESKDVSLAEGKRLEDSFSSESLSDTEEAQSEDSQKESEDVSSVETIKEEEEEPHVIELNSISTHMSKEIVEAKRLSKPRFFARLKSISLLLVLLIACLSISVTDSPVIGTGTAVLKDSGFSKLYDPSEIAELARANFDGLAQNFRLWSANTISHLSKLIPILREVDKLGPLHFSNFTASPDDCLVDGYLTIDHGGKGTEDDYEQNELGPMREGEVEMDPLEEKGHPETETDDNIVEASEEDHGNPEFEQVRMTLQTEVVMEPDNSEEEQIYYENDIALHIESERQSSIDFKDQSVLISQTSAEIQPEESKTVELQGENGLNSCAEIESTESEVSPKSSELNVLHGNSQSLETLDSTLDESEHKVLAQNVLGISLLVLALIAATASIIYLKKDKTSNPKAAFPTDQSLTKKLISSPISASMEHTYQERRSSRNWPTEVDMVGESCPSEMSSFQKSSSYSNKGLRGTNEAQSHERKPRKNSKRESLASSSEYSMGSASYGSFTTFEKIPIKHGCGEEETVTPVRRSSRIRSQVTSP